MLGRAGLSIGELSTRTGLAVSAIRFYEQKGLIHPLRNAGNQRRFDRADIRRMSFIMISQQMGFPLARIGDLLAGLPHHKAPTKRDWTRISGQFQAEIDRRIDTLTTMRERLDACIGCGCLSMRQCHLFNRKDNAAAHGPGPRYLLGDSPPGPPD